MKLLRGHGPVVVTVLALVLALLGAAWRMASARCVVLVLADLQASQQEQQRSPDALLSANLESAYDRMLSRFTYAASNPDAVLKEVRRAAAGLGVVVPAVVFAESRGTDQLGRVDMSLTLGGSYANVKAVLADALDRHPGLVLQRISIRKVSVAPADVQAQIGLRLASLPETASAAGR